MCGVVDMLLLMLLIAVSVFVTMPLVVIPVSMIVTMTIVVITVSMIMSVAMAVVIIAVWCGGGGKRQREAEERCAEKYPKVTSIHSFFVIRVVYTPVLIICS